MNMTLDYQLRQMLEGLQHPGGMMALAVLCFVAVLLAAIRSMRWVGVAITLYVCTFGISGLTGFHLAWPLQDLREYGRGLCAFMLVVLLIPTIRSNRGWRFHIMSTALVFYFIFELVISMRTLYAGDFTRGYFGAISYVLIILTFGLGLARWLQDEQDVRALLRAVAAGGGLFVIGSLYQYFINPADIVWGNRLLGTTGNANHAALVLASSIPPACYMFLRTGGRTAWRLGYAILIAALSVCLVWTGSRTGGLVALLGIVLLFRFRLGKLAVALAICGVLVFTMIKVLDETGISTIASRFLDIHDTRSEAWGHMIDMFKANPVIGAEAADVMVSENSYLLIASRTGMVGLIPFTISVVAVIVGLIKLQRIKPFLREHVLLADLVTAGIVSIAVGGMFEGYLFATYSFPLFTLFIYANLMLFLFDYARANQLQMLAAQEWQEIDPESYPDYAEQPQYEPVGHPQHF